MANDQAKPTSEAWHLDKRVPLALLFAIIMQTAGAAWVAGQIVNRVNFLERDLERQRVTQERHSGSINDLDRALGRQDEKLNSILRILSDVRSDLGEFKAEHKQLLQKIPR